jgi:site-specific recombinase XerD
MKEYSINLVLDRRRPKANKLFPVKLRIYSPVTSKAKLYPTKFDLTEKDFQSIWETVKTRAEFRQIKMQFNAIVAEADEVCSKIIPFSFEQFEKKFFRAKGDELNVIYHYKKAIQTLMDRNAIGTASNYRLALKSLMNFVEFIKGKQPTNISFLDITPLWLNNYENYMINELKRSRTTVSMYIRTLRTVFNNAIREKDIDAEFYPFGKNKYQPHNVSNVKKALPKADLKKLFEAVPNTPEQEKAKDFWFFSYVCNGMNIKDIALLTFENVSDTAIEFYRAKTITTSKTDLRPVKVLLTKYAKGVIAKYANVMDEKDDYLFPILQKTDTEIEKHNKIKNFTKFINQNLKKLALANGITDDISTYWARHSFATNAVRSGATMEFVSEALNHNNLKTTQNYFAGFEEEDKLAIANKLMDFS